VSGLRDRYSQSVDTGTEQRCISLSSTTIHIHCTALNTANNRAHNGANETTATPEVDLGAARGCHVRSIVDMVHDTKS
jgi:hypothetical protein